MNAPPLCQMFNLMVITCSIDTDRQTDTHSSPAEFDRLTPLPPLHRCQVTSLHVDESSFSRFHYSSVLWLSEYNKDFVSSHPHPLRLPALRWVSAAQTAAFRSQNAVRDRRLAGGRCSGARTPRAQSSQSSR